MFGGTASAAAWPCALDRANGSRDQQEQPCDHAGATSRAVRNVVGSGHVTNLPRHSTTVTPAVQGQAWK